MNLNATMRTRLLICTALAPAIFMPTVASAQDAAAKSDGLEEIVVTAQKREQSLQDVPVAVTAVSQSSIESNRIVNVADLSSVAPNVTVRPAAGGTGIAMFTVRGVNSYGVAPGSDKEVSINLDGVYISSARGSIFDIADITRIEVLRGPQGTLFGRNATAGAVSIITRDPTGHFGATQTFTLGNFDQRRSRTTIDLPQVGPFSAYVSFVHNERRGDTVNTNAGVVWDKTAPNGFGKETSPKTLGDHDSNAVFAAVKFEPTDNFKMTYKFDWSGDHFTPEANTAIVYNKATSDGKVITALMANQGPNGMVPVFAPTGQRTGFASNAWTTPGYQRNAGHNLTAEWRASDTLTVKNILAYRSNYLYGASALVGLGGMVITPAANTAIQADTTISASTRALINANVGNRYLDYGTQRLYNNQQWSEELQLNFTTNDLNLTVGGIYFHSKEREGGPDTLFSSKNKYVGIPDATGLLPQANGTIGANSPAEAIFYNQADSYAVYGQAEIHLLPVLDLVAGIRLTEDDKSGTFKIGGTWVPSTPGSRTSGTMTYTATEQQSFYNRHGEPSYSVGLNYKPSNDLLVYGKYSRSYVSGGQVASLTWKPEIAKSWEAGIKATMLDSKLRANLSVFHVTYENLQLAQGGATFAATFPSVANVPVVIVGMNVPVKVKGFELELTAAPTRGLTLGANLGYVDEKIDGVIDPLVLITASSAICGLEFATAADHGAACAAANSSHYHLPMVPAWTSNLYAQYDTGALVAGGHLSFRLDASFRSAMRLDANDDAPLPGFEPVEMTPATWIVNGRMALQDMELGAVKTTLALWARNLFDDKSIQFTGGISGVSRSASFSPARTFGADLTVKF